MADLAYESGTVAKMTDRFLHADAHPSGTTNDGRRRMSFKLKSSTTLAFYCVSLVIVQKSTPRVIDTNILPAGHLGGEGGGPSERG
jgi:hypothetical protein